MLVNPWSTRKHFEVFSGHAYAAFESTGVSTGLSVPFSPLRELGFPVCCYSAQRTFSTNCLLTFGYN